MSNDSHVLTPIDEVTDLDYTKTRIDGTTMNRESQVLLAGMSTIEEKQAYKNP